MGEALRVATAERTRAEAQRERLLSEEQNARAQADAANRAKDEFLAVLSHELRTPLNAVFGWARMLLAGQVSPRRHPRTRSRPSSATRTRRSQLIDDLLDVSRIATGKLRLDVRPVDLHVAVSEALDAVRPAAAGEGDPPPQRARSRGRPRRRRPGPAPAGRVEPADERGEVHPEGRPRPGSPAASQLPRRDHRQRHRPGHRPRVPALRLRALPPGRQLQHAHARRARARAGPGQAPGRAARRHRRRAQPRPREGRHLRRAPARAPADLSDGPTPRRTPPRGRASGRPAGPALDGLRVLVVDDEPESLALAAMVFVAARAPRSAPVSRPPEALEELARWRPDVLVSDIEMPGEDGYSLHSEGPRAARTRAPGSPPSPSPPTGGPRTGCARSRRATACTSAEPVKPAIRGLVSMGAYRFVGAGGDPVNTLEPLRAKPGIFGGLVVIASWAQLQPTPDAELEDGNAIDKAMADVRAYNAEHPDKPLAVEAARLGRLHGAGMGDAARRPADRRRCTRTRRATWAASGAPSTGRRGGGCRRSWPPGTTPGRSSARCR